MPTQLKTRCPHCSAAIKINDRHVGQRIHCPACHKSFDVASATTAGPVSLEVALPANETVAATADKTADTSDIVPASRTPALPRPKLGCLGRFELKEVLGQGAFGRVYNAYDPQLDRELALKVPTFGPQDIHKIRRFNAEAKAAASLRHPNIVPTYESGQIGNQYYIATQFVAGQTLARRIAEGKPPFRQSAEWIRRLAAALGYAHAAGVVHRDIKPENVMVDEFGVPHIMDFGLAKRLNDDATMTADGSVLGTPAYMSPEQARGDLASVGPLSDQYSLGVVLFQLLTGKKPFDGLPHSVIAKVIATDPPAPRTLNQEIPVDLAAICEIAMNKNAAERYPSCEELGEDLARWLDGLETQARPLRKFERGWRWYRKNALAAGLACTATVLLMFLLFTTGVLIWTFFPNDQPLVASGRSNAETVTDPTGSFIGQDTDSTDSPAENATKQEQQLKSQPVAGSEPINKGALRFDGIDDYVQVPVARTKGFPLGDAPRTVEFWCKTMRDLRQGSGTSTFQYGLAQPGRMFSLIFEQRELYTQPAHRGKFYFYGHSLDSSRSAPSKTVIEPSTWYHVAVTYDGSNVTIFVDSQIDGTWSLALNTKIDNDGLLLGYRPLERWHWQGELDEFRLWDIARTPQEIQRDMRLRLGANDGRLPRNLVAYYTFDDGTATDLAGGDNHGELASGAKAPTLTTETPLLVEPASSSSRDGKSLN